VRLFDLGTFPSAEGRLLYNLARATSLATAALLGALGPCRPGISHTVDGTSVHVARLGNLKITTCNTTVGIFADHATAVDLVASAARLGAFAKGSPFGVLAIDSAFLAVTSLGFGSRTACGTAADGLCDDGTQALFVTLATGLVACTPLTPFREFAVIRASFDVAFDFDLQQGAFVATMAGLGNNFTGARHDATAAGLGAFTPGVPLGHVTVNGTITFVALARFIETGAHFTTVFRVSLDSALSGGPSRATGHTARRPCVPLVDSAVNRASLSVASSLLLKSAAGLATECSRYVHTTTALLFTTTTCVRAGSPFFPSGHLAIHRAYSGAACLGLFK